MIDRPTIEDIAYRSRWGQTDGHLTFTDFRHPGVLHVALEPLSVRVSLDGRVETAVGARESAATWLAGVFIAFATGAALPAVPPPPEVPVDLPPDLPPVAGESPAATLARQVVLARRGQGLYRQRLLAAWGGACAVTGLAEPPLLMASHAKPWRAANDDERLDGENGLPLIPDLDRLFDSGLISFGDDGKILLSDGLSTAAATTLGVTSTTQLRQPLTAKQKAYLAYHREHVFGQGPIAFS